MKSSPAAVFRAQHGDPITWSTAEIETQQVLALVANPPTARRTSTLRTRAAVVATIAYAAPLYALMEVITAVRGTSWQGLEHLLDRADDRLLALEDAAIEAGDIAWADQIAETTDRLVVDPVNRLTGRLTARS
ncbi:hypothetical protein ACH4FE_35770 [Streptomyces celluloflavus]|uniref:hypothetical protein n=1 Tax=Streptomyces celluloflavus TaxID=58344 RepID=UPI0037A08994